MANNLSGEVPTPDHLGCTPALPVIKHRGLYLPSVPFGSSTSSAPCGPMVERRRLGLDPSKLLGIQIVIGTNRFAKDGKSRNYVASKFGRSCAKAFAKKFGLIRKAWALTYAILSRYHGLSQLRTFWKTLCKKRAFLGQTQCLMGKKCPFTWYVIYILYIAYHTELILQQNEGSLIGKIQNPSPCVGNCPVKHQFMTLILALWLHYQLWPYITKPKVKKVNLK